MDKLRVFRLRSEKYLAYVRTKGCVICGGRADAHHLQRAQPRALGKKTGDQWTVALCRTHHMQLHEFPGGEDTFWAVNGILPMMWAENTYNDWKEQQLWQHL